MKRVILLAVLLSFCALHGNAPIQNSIRKMFINDTPKLIVDWTPKAGCTSVWVMLMKGYGLLDEALRYSHWIHKYRRHVYNKRHTTTQAKFFSPEYYKVKFVRNPYERAVSSYLHVCKKTTYTKSFEDFLGMLKTQKWSGLTVREINVILSHAKKQFKITDQFMHEIIHIEDADLAKVNRATGLNLTFVKHDSHHHNAYTTCDQYCGDKPYTKLDCYPDYHCYYSQKTLQLVQELYGQDITTYNYPIPEKIAQFLARTH